MKLAAVAASLSLTSLLLPGCATSVDELGGTTRPVDSAVVTDAGGDASGKDTADAPRDTAVPSADTKPAIDSATGSDTLTSTDTSPEFDSDVPDTSPIEDTALPPTDAAPGTCTVDTDCSPPFNCCDTSSNKCSIIFIFICLPVE
jgi:hypothetical protein